MTILGCGDFCKLASRTAQATHGMIVEMLSRLLDNRPPDLSAIHGDKILNSVVNRLSYFISCEKTLTGNKKKRVFGAEVAQLMLDNVVTKNSSATSKPCEVALPHPQEQVVDRRQPLEGHRRRRHEQPVPRGQEGGRSGASNDTRKQDAAVAEAMSLFS